MNFNTLWKRTSPYLLVVVLFVVVSNLYFAPAQFEGKVLFQDDGAASVGLGSDVEQHFDRTGETSRWTNSAFSGMPMYPFMGDSYYVLGMIEKIYRLYFNFLLKGESWLTFVMLLGFFILMKSLRIRNDLAVLGALMWAFSSYFFIIIGAGHIWKYMALSYIPPTIAGLIYAYRGNYLQGGALTAFFMMLQVKSNHPQMSYYFIFVMAAIAVVYLIDAIKEKQLLRFGKATAVLFVAALLGVASNLTNVYHSYEYSKHTMRGGSELSLPSVEGAESTSNASGLDRDYITNWSIGLGETWSLLIPNVKGKATGAIGNDNLASANVRAEYKQFVAQQNAYWGNQPFTSGAVYVGSFVCLLFVLGLFIVQSRLKWALLAMTIFSIVLAWGRNFMPITDLFINYVPMYAKFRAVSSILVIAEFTIPLLAILTLKEILDNPSLLKEKRQAVVVSFAATGGLCALFALAPTLFFDFFSYVEADHYFTQAQTNPQLAEVVALIEQVRAGIFTADAWRSFAFIVVGCGVLAAFTYGKLKPQVAVLLLGVVIIVDLWGVDKRYLNYNSYHSPKNVSAAVNEKSEADKVILADPSLSYRVFNTTVSPFNDNTTSRFHQSVGGYHAAKLQRYQDVIDHQLTKGNPEVFNMLNTKYFIVKGEDGKPTAQLNERACGNGWFVGAIRWVNDANEEMTELGKINPRNVALIDKRFESTLKSSRIAAVDSAASITLVESLPNKLVYKTQSSFDGLALFSEVFYPEGWTATVDGKETPIVRANYILRAIEIPAGSHDVVFSFDLSSIRTTEIISNLSLALTLLLFIGMVVYNMRKRPQAAE